MASILYLIDLTELAGNQTSFASEEDLIFFADQMNDLHTFVLLAYLLVIVVAYVINAVWIYRATTNAAAMYSYPKRIGPGWAIGFHAIPILNFWKPYVSARQTWNTSTRSDMDPDASAPRFLKVWWVLWLTLSALGILSQNFYSTYTLEGYRASTIADLCNGPVSLMCAVLFYRFVRDVSKAQSAAGVEKVFA
ncbi:MAG: DUF4328 domain-containing protein [Pseudomonadota bacterium]